MNSTTTTDKFSNSWRYKVGLALIIVGHAALLVGFASPMLGFTGGFAATFAVGGEIISLLSIVFLGMEGFKRIKRKILGAIRGGFVSPVGRARHYIGIVLFTLNGVSVWIVLVLVLIIYSRATDEAPTPVVWGLDWKQQLIVTKYLLIGGEVAFVVSIYVLGARGWERLRRFVAWTPDEE